MFRFLLGFLAGCVTCFVAAFIRQAIATNRALDALSQTGAAFKRDVADRLAEYERSGGDGA